MDFPVNINACLIIVTLHHIVVQPYNCLLTQIEIFHENALKLSLLHKTFNNLLHKQKV